MSSPLIPQHSKDPLVEKLVGETGDPQVVKAAGRALAVRAIPDVLAALKDAVAHELQLEVQAVETVRFTAAGDVAPNGVMVVVGSATSPDALAIQAGPDTVGLLISALFGGDPDQPADPVERRLSPIETELVATLFNAVAHAFNGTGERAMKLALPVGPPVSGGDIAKLQLRDGPAARIDFKLSSPAGIGTLRVTMPQRVLLSHRGQGRAGSQAEPPTSGSWKQRFGEEVMRASVTLEAAIPLAKMNLGEVAALKPGQVIPFPADAQSNTRLSARRKTVFVCEFGKLGNHFTVRVRHPYDAGKEFMDELVSG